MAAFARKCEQEFVTAFFTFHPCKAIVQNTAVQIAVDNLFDVGSEITVFLCETGRHRLVPDFQNCPRHTGSIGILEAFGNGRQGMCRAISISLKEILG